MKTKKIYLPAIILVIAVLAIAVCAVVISIAKKPSITEAEFSFSITYTLDGETITIKDVYKVRYVRNDGYADTKSRVYVGEIGDLGENNTIYTLKKDANGRIELWTHFYADYMMGDSDGDYFDEEPFEPRIYYFDSEEIEYSDEKTLSSQGVKLISFEYPSPIENTLVFSHISYFSSTVVLPTLLIALIALGVVIAFVRKEKDLVYKKVDTISIVLDFVVCFTLLPFVTIAGLLIDINGGGPEISRQMFYFMPSFFALCTGASVALRRKGYGVKSLVAVLVAPTVFALWLIACAILGLV